VAKDITTIKRFRKPKMIRESHNMLPELMSHQHTDISQLEKDQELLIYNRLPKLEAEITWLDFNSTL